MASEFWKLFTVVIYREVVTIKSCNDAVGVFRGCCRIPVRSWQVCGKTTVINGNPELSVTEWTI